MKKLIILALASSALAVPAAAPAAHGNTFNSRGECESFLAQARNDARKTAMEAGANAGQFNRDYPVFCQDNGDGTFTTELEDEDM